MVDFFLIILIVRRNMSAPVPGLTVSGRIVRVIDGDTVEFEVTRRIRVRLLDCWAPESRTKDLREKRRGLFAKSNMQKLVESCSDATLFVPASSHGDLSGLFTMGRVLGQLWRKGDVHSLAQLQVLAGAAFKDDPRKKKKRLKDPTAA
jgi:micrococcal nuclease